MKLRTHAAVLTFCTLVFHGLADAQQPLEEVFATGFMLQDRNADGVVDFVDAELVLGDDPSAPVLAAASDVAVRLGFETLAMDLPLTATGDGVGIAIGTSAAETVGVDTSGLAQDEGLVTTAAVDGRDWLVIAGRNDQGTRLAATALAGRLPHLWAPDGPTLDDVLSSMSESLSRDAVTPTSLSVSRIVVREDRLAELAVRVEVPSGQAAIARQRLLSEAPSYEHVETVVLQIDGGEVRLPRGELELAAGPIPPRPGAGAKRSLDLGNLYTPDGLLGDADTNLIPDRIDAVLSPATSAAKVVDLAARLGLESTGMSVPIVRLPEDIEEASSEPTLVLIGAHPLLSEAELPQVELEPDEGVLRVIPKAFGAKTALVVGGTGDGLDRALEQLTERLPHIWNRGKDRTTIDDIEMDVWKFISARSPAGQAAAALYKLERIIDELDGQELRSARVLVSIEKPAPEIGQVVRERARRLGVPESSLEVVIDDRDVQNAGVIFEDELTLESEVEAFRNLFRQRVLPRVKGRDDVRVELRLSEPPEILSSLASEVRDELGERAEVRVISAYKQGYSWLYDVIRPRLADAGATDVTIRFARYQPPLEWSQQAMHTPLRWLHEAFPIDEILARELDLDLSRVRFEAAPPGEDPPPYEVIAYDASGAEVLRESFAPKLVLRPYIDRFRDYEMVNVTTGWLRVELGGENVIDQRIATDAERFWDHYQQNTIPAMYDYVMERHRGNPRGAGKDAPLFGELQVELTLSEPDYRLDLDQEIVSTMDALHEDIYFTTLMFYRILGRNARGEELTYPGRVLPIMTPKADGTAGTGRIRFTGFATHRPAVVVDYVRADGSEGSERLDVHKVATERPRALTAFVRAGTDGITKLELRVKVDTETDERDAFVERARSEQVDERILSAAQVIASLEHLSSLRERGLYTDALAYHGLGELSVSAGWEHDVDWGNEPRANLRGGAPAAVPDVQRFAGGSNATELVQWDTPIPPAEAYGILARMDGFDEATVYKVGESYLGQDVWAMDLMPPVSASHLSRYKATTLKPTVVYSARQHANEVSSTSHVLKLAELLLTEPEMRAKLDRVNVVIHPITNPDGAQLAYDLYRRTPDLILHAGYYASLGMDVTSDGNQPMPIYPESTIRRELWNSWLPDIFLNPHGYPSHQLVQLFSEYTGLVRRGRITERNWSMNKGWFMPGFSYTDDPRFPRHKDAAFEIRDYITRAVGEAADVVAMNDRNYDRYRRYGEHFDEDEVFKLPLVDDILIHTAIKGDRAPGPGSSRGYNPKITVWSGTTEAPDETAYGDWMKLVATAGLQWDKAILQYLVDGDHRVERNGSSFFGGVSLSMDRPRPPKDAEEDVEGAEP